MQQGARSSAVVMKLGNPMSNPMSNRVERKMPSSIVLEGTAVVGRDGDRIGSIESAIMDRASGALSCVVVDARRFGFVGPRYLLSWDCLVYDSHLVAYRVGLTRRQLQAASLPENPFGIGL
jgi:PRC-barrel domain